MPAPAAELCCVPRHGFWVPAGTRGALSLRWEWPKQSQEHCTRLCRPERTCVHALQRGLQLSEGLTSQGLSAFLVSCVLWAVFRGQQDASWFCCYLLDVHQEREPLCGGFCEVLLQPVALTGQASAELALNRLGPHAPWRVERRPYQDGGGGLRTTPGVPKETGSWRETGGSGSWADRSC